MGSRSKGDGIGMDELRQRLKQATDALEAAAVPIEAPEASRALQLVVEAHTELRQIEAALWWRRGRVKRRLAEVLDALQNEVKALVATPVAAQREVGPEFA